MSVKMEDLLKVRKQVNNINDLKKLANANNISYNETDLKRAYDVLVSNQEISEDALENISGGGLKYTDDGYIIGKCPKCKNEMKVKQNSIECEVCPNCWTPVSCQNIKGC